MAALTTINDTHCGAIRSGGTTPQTAWALRQWVLLRFGMLLSLIKTDLLILGDLLDSFSIPYTDLFEVYGHLKKWLRDNPDQTLYLVPGNHDLSKTMATMSSFQFLCKLLQHEKNVVIMDKPGRLRGHDAYVIPHVPNQDLFNIELDKVPDDVGTLYLHCNYDNKFAQKSDHSLNLSMDQAMKLPVRRIVFAHEHQGRTAQGGKVIVIGNQIPTSVADCLGNRVKHMLVVEGDKIEHVEVWDEDGSFWRADWRDLSAVPSEAQFVRVEGDASAAEAAAVASAVSKLRNQNKTAFVITNAVKIEGRGDEGEAQSLEKVQSFSVFDALMRRLTPAQQAVVKKLMEDNNVSA
jgi:metallophosphoesterase superfamily enzyme